MRNIIKTEFLKLKRYSVIKAGIIMTTLSPLLSLFYSTANGGPTWTFDYFMQQVMISNCTLFFPIIIALIAGYIITREYTDDTMKNILTIPIPYKQLLILGSPSILPTRSTLLATAKKSMDPMPLYAALFPDALFI